jgi:hypothetical protein
MVSCSLLLAACSTPKIWPFYKKPKPAPEVVQELELVNPDGTAARFAQFWKRNTLVIDLSAASGTGTVAARLPEERTWPVRVALRVQPGSVEQLEIIGEERNVLAVTRDGSAPLDLEFAPSIYRPNTGTIYIKWGPMPQFAEAVPESAPGFVSPTQVPEEAAESPSANDIVAPGEAGGVQPSPPPGS